MRPSTNSPSHFLPQTAACDRAARTHCTGEGGRAHYPHRSTHVDFPSALHYPPITINPPSGAFITQSLSCDSSPRDNMYLHST